MKVHPNFPEYVVSVEGRVFRATRSRMHSKIGDEIFGRVLKSGYRQFKLIDATEKQRAIRANRLVAETYLGPAPTLQHHAAHFDGNRLNNHISNLRWATPKENMADRDRHGSTLRGELVGTARLSADKVQQIRNSYTGRRGELTKLSQQFGVGTTTIRRVVEREYWRHI